MNIRALIHAFAGIGAYLQVDRYLHLGGLLVPTTYELTLIRNKSQAYYRLCLHEGKPSSLVITCSEIQSESPSIYLELASAQKYPQHIVCGLDSTGYYLHTHQPICRIISMQEKGGRVSERKSEARILSLCS